MLYFWLGVMSVIWLYMSIKLADWLAIDEETGKKDYFVGVLTMLGSAALFHWVVSIILQ